MTASEHLLAGFAEIDISPPLATQIAGDIGRPRPTEGTKLGVLVLDLFGVGHEWADRIRDGAAARQSLLRGR